MFTTIRNLLAAVPAAVASAATVSSTHLRPLLGEGSWRALSSLTHAPTAPEPGIGLRRSFCVAETSPANRRVMDRAAACLPAAVAAFRNRIPGPAGRRGRTAAALLLAVFCLLGAAQAVQAQSGGAAAGNIDPPRDISAASDVSQVTLYWYAPKYDIATPVRGYQVRVSADGGTTWGPDWPANGAGTLVDAPYTVPNLTNGTEYTFEVRAVNDAGTGTAARVSGTPVATATVDANQTTIWWSAVLTVGRSGATYGYDWFSNIGQGNLSSNTFSHGGVRYRVDRLLYDGEWLRFRLSRPNSLGGMHLRIGQAVYRMSAPNQTSENFHEFRWRKSEADRSDMAEGEQVQVVLGGPGALGNTRAAGSLLIQGGSGTATDTLRAARIGDALRADVSGVSDADGMSSPDWQYEWFRSACVGCALESVATGEAYSPVASDVGRHLMLRASFRDNRGNLESFVRHTAQVAATPLTAEFRDLPAAHDGSGAFTFEFALSENIEGLSYRTVQGSVLSVTGGQVMRARRLSPPSNRRWELTVEPGGDARPSRSPCCRRRTVRRLAPSARPTGGSSRSRAPAGCPVRSPSRRSPRWKRRR